MIKYDRPPSFDCGGDRPAKHECAIAL